MASKTGWDVDLRTERLRVIEIEPPLLDVADDADDLEFATSVVENDALADGVGMREILAREDLVDRRDRRRVLRVLIVL